MTFEVVVGKRARDYVASMQIGDAKRVGRAFKELETNPTPAGAIKMEGRMGRFHRIRVGNYRSIYEIKREIRIIAIIDVGPRGEVYKGY